MKTILSIQSIQNNDTAITSMRKYETTGLSKIGEISQKISQNLADVLQILPIWVIVEQKLSQFR